MTWLVIIHVYWSLFKKILGESPQKSIYTLPSLIIILDISLLLEFCITFVLVHDS